jgi:hypothetical protein
LFSHLLFSYFSFSASDFTQACACQPATIHLCQSLIGIFFQKEKLLGDREKELGDIRDQLKQSAEVGIRLLDMVLGLRLEML